MNDGDTGAEKARVWFALLLLETPNRGNGDPNACLLEPLVLSDRFFVFRIFLLGEPARLNPARCGGGPAGKLSWLITLSSLTGEDVFSDEKDESGNDKVGDSGDELGDGSVSVESRVDIVVVGDESEDSDLKVLEELRRYM